MVVFRECWHILALSAALAPAAYMLAPALAAAPAALFAFTLYFFRDPERTPPSAPGTVISPADGRVLYVEETSDPFAGESRRVAIFMSPFDVHVNRAPLDCKVASVKHTPGRKIAAYLRGDLAARERNRVELQGAVKVAVEQYAGVVARRIVCNAREGAALKAGERYGMIKFGSRVDVIMPLNVKVKVSKDMRVRAGETVVGVADG